MKKGGGRKDWGESFSYIFPRSKKKKEGGREKEERTFALVLTTFLSSSVGEEGRGGKGGRCAVVLS